MNRYDTEETEEETEQREKKYLAFMQADEDAKNGARALHEEQVRNQPPEAPKPLIRSAPPVRAKATADDPTSEHVIALEFTNKFRDTMRYCPELGSWFEWDKIRWRPDKLQRGVSLHAHPGGRSRKSKGHKKSVICTRRRIVLSSGPRARCRGELLGRGPLEARHAERYGGPQNRAHPGG